MEIDKVLRAYVMPDPNAEDEKSLWTGPVLLVLEGLIKELLTSSEIDVLKRCGGPSCWPVHIVPC